VNVTIAGHATPGQGPACALSLLLALTALIAKMDFTGQNAMNWNLTKARSASRHSVKQDFVHSSILSAWRIRTTLRNRVQPVAAGIAHAPLEAGVNSMARATVCLARAEIRVTFVKAACLARIAPLNAREMKAVPALVFALPQVPVTATPLIRVSTAMRATAVPLVLGVIWSVALARPALGGDDVSEMQLTEYLRTGVVVLIAVFSLRIITRNVNVVRVLQVLIAAIALYIILGPNVKPIVTRWILVEETDTAIMKGPASAWRVMLVRSAMFVIMDIVVKNATDSVPVTVARV
jgi:hypothetical protein